MTSKQPLSVTHPELAKQANGWDPSLISGGTNKKQKWLCANGHQYESSPHSRTSQNNGCPYCSNQKVLVGFNDLATTHPDIAREAEGWDPQQVIGGSEKKRLWKCSLGHVYPAMPASRTRMQTGCPTCSNRKLLVGFNDLATTHPEIAREADGWDPTSIIAGKSKLMSWLCPKGHKYESLLTNRTRHNTGCNFCTNKKVLSGFNDLTTTHPLIASEAEGWDPRKVIAGNHTIRKWTCPQSHLYEASTHSRTTKKSACPYCSNQKVLVGFNDLATTHPDIAREAEGWDPQQVIGGSEKKRLWKCSLGHIYETSPASRTGQKTGCHYCVNKKVLLGFNDLATTHPDIAREAEGWDPSEVVAGSNLKKKWSCAAGHYWITTPNSRTGNKTGCPTCTSGGFDPNADSWIYFMRHPHLGYLQVGITNQIHIRMSVHERAGWELIEVRGPMDGHLCQNWETSILRMLRKSGASMGPRKADLHKKSVAEYRILYGTEMWVEDSLRVTSIAELMSRTDKFEER
jgi:hypothetical protein